MFEDVIIEQNPHWVGAFYEQGVERECFTKLKEYLAPHMVIAIMGVRRSGKSTLQKQLINYLIEVEKIPSKNILFLNFEHPYFAQASKDIKNLQKIYEDYLKLTDAQGKIYCFFDEVQQFEGWPLFVKAHYEQKKIKFILTGSNSLLISSDLATLLSGRALPLEVFPLSFQEVVSAAQIKSDDPIVFSSQRPKIRALLTQQLQYGGFPEVVLNLMPTIAYDILNAYVKTILYQDVAPRLQLRKSIELERLFFYLISNIGKPFSYANISELFDLSDKVIKEYIGAFEDSFLLFELDKFDYSVKKQIKHQKKIYAIDVGIVNAAAFHISENMGRLLENLVFLEIRRLGVELFYYKTKQGFEVDFCVKKFTKYALVQVCLVLQDQQTRERELKALIAGLEELKLFQGLIITQDYDEEVEIEGGKIIMISAYKFFCLTIHQKMEMLQLV